MLSLQGLGATIGSGFRLDDLSFNVRSDERLAVLGPNGSGKSFLLRLILGLAKPRAGRISWGDKVLSEGQRIRVEPEDREMGVVFQEGALFPHLNVRQNVDLAIPKETKGEPRTKKVDRALEIARIGHLDRRSVHALSGGEQQRVAIARALVHSPKLLLLDEPFHSLDGPLKREILAEVRALVREEEIATILVTHDTEEAATFADRVVLLRKGRLIQEGTFEELYNDPADRLTAEFMGPLGVIEGELALTSEIELSRGGGEQSVFFRPEHFELTPIPESQDGGLEIVDVHRQGAFLDVAVKLSDGSEVISRALAGSTWRAGQRVSARISKTLTLSSAEELGT